MFDFLPTPLPICCEFTIILGIGYWYLGPEITSQFLRHLSNCCKKRKPKRTLTPICINKPDRSPSPKPKRNKKVILITDIGRDTDSPLALIALAKHPTTDLIGVITTGGNTTNRARVARYWLRMSGVEDSECTVIPDYSTTNYILDSKTRASLEQCHVSLSADSADASAIMRKTRYDALEFLILETERWGKDLTIICMGKTTVLADACEINPYIMKRVGKIVMPGEMKFRKNERKQYLCCPKFEKSLKLAEDLQSSHFVIAELSRSVPFYFVSENVVQGLTITRRMVQDIPGYMLTVRDTYKFVKDNYPDLFMSLHNIPSEYKPATWFSYVNKVCWPHCTLMTLSILEPQLFSISRERYGNFHVLLNITEKERENALNKLLEILKNTTEEE